MSTLDPVLIVDDDALILRAVERSLKSRFAITTAPDADTALRYLDGETAWSVIVSDLQMPGTSGLALLEVARRHAPDAVRILLSGEVQVTDAVRAVNEGEVYRLLLKPCTVPTLSSAIAEGCERHRASVAERTISEQALHGAIQALSEVLATAQPAAFGRATRLRRHVADLAEAYGVLNRWDIEVAAMLSQLGCIALPPNTVDRWYHNQELTAAEQAQVDQLPELAEQVVASIPRLESVRAILRAQHAPSPHGEAPLGARMLAIARDFDLLIARGIAAEDAISLLEGRTGRYDSDLLRTFRSIRGSDAPSAILREMRLIDVANGMVFAEDVMTPTGLVLIARGQPVTSALQHRIRVHWCDFALQREVRMVAPGTVDPTQPIAGSTAQA